MQSSDRQRGLSPAGLSATSAVVALVLTLTVLLVPYLRLAYREPQLHVVLETAEAVIALVAAYLLHGRFRRTGQVRALLLTAALVTVAVANLLLQAMPRAVGTDELTPWAALLVRLVGVVLLTAAALTPPRARISQTAGRSGLWACAAVVVLLGLVAVRFGPLLPPAVDPALDLRDGTFAVVGGHPLTLAAQAVSAVLYAVASVAFTRQAARGADELLRWLGAGCALAAVARLNYLLFPSLYSDYVYTGDLLRLGFYAFLLIGAMREVRSYWELQTQLAVVEDRRRLARDLHDGLTQELTYISTQSRLLVRSPGDAQVAERIGSASLRAVDEARNAIAALTRTTDDSFASVLHQSVEGLAGRYGATARVSVEQALQLPPEHGDAVLRIVAEAFRNAVRHGQAASVDVELTGAPRVLTIRDDGRGFDRSVVNTSATGGGFGLTSMRERAEGVGAALTLQSSEGAGTTVEVRWPR